jgi:hypothetical protein
MAKTLILPCTIDARNCLTNGRKDIETRKSDYLFSIGKYHETTSLKLIVAENSGYDLSFLKEKFPEGDRIEYISVNDNQSASIYGKGHAEKQLLRYVLKNSKTLRNDSFFFKVTGRYFSPDIEIIINSVNTDKTDSVQRFPEGNGNIPTVFFGARKDKFLEFFSDEMIISDAAEILEAAYSRFILTLENVLWLTPIKYENAICSNGTRIEWH